MEVKFKIESTSVWSRAKKAWNVFFDRDTYGQYAYYGPGSSFNPDRPRLTRGNERSIITSLYNRLSIDAASIDIKHVRVDENNRYLEDLKSGLSDCFNVEANIDQTAFFFKLDIFLTLLDNGVVAIVPIDTDDDPNVTGSFNIETMRVGKIVDWYPQHVKVSVYDERDGQRKEVIVSKKIVAIIENPFYSIINEPNSVLQRLIRKLNILDAVDEQSGSGKLDLIIQLPYVIKSEARRVQAEQRRKDIETQLSGSKYGIAYTDGSEHITQLNRAVENNLMGQIEYLTSMLYSQLGITQEILNGTANEQTMMNYYSRTIDPLVSSVVYELRRKFLTKTARTQMQSIVYFRDPFKLVPVSNIAEISDKMTRNEIMTSNEIRQIVGLKPSDDPNADELRNKNLNKPVSEADPVSETDDSEGYEYEEEIDEGYEEGSDEDSTGIDISTLFGGG